MTTAYQQFDSTFSDPFAPQMTEASTYNNAIVPYDETQLQKESSSSAPPPSPSPVTTMASSSPRFSSNAAIVPYNNPPNITVMHKSHPLRQKMKKQRQRRTVGAAVGGTIVGGIILGPVGMVVGGAGAAAASRKICKTGEKRVVRKIERQLVQKEASNSQRAIHLASFA
mmetsp:Transcript_4489/g.6842  ORF Transcript_4489/g.6842 Transcript_4489/m.6842 type:complete len:169 (-) Transcript_4489:142-648(-)